MKKKRYRIMSLVLALAMSFCAFALTACTDKKDKPRELDSVEQSLIGQWYDSQYDYTYLFHSDGTWERILKKPIPPREYKHIGSGVDNSLGGHYEIIDYSLGKHALFDIYPNRLYSIDSDGQVIDRYIERQ